MTNKIDTVLKAMIDQIMGVLLSDSVKNPKLNVNSTSLVLSARSYPTRDPQCSSYPPNLINAIKTCSKETNLSQKDKLQEVTEIGTQRPEEPEQTLEDEFKDLHLNYCLELGKNGFAFIQDEMPKRMEDPGLFTLPCRLWDSKPFDTLSNLGSCVNIISLYLYKKLKIILLEETGHVFGLAEGTKSYHVEIVRDVEVHIGKLKLLNDFFVIDMKKDPETTLLVGRGFLATANAFIDCRKAKIAVGEGITKSVFRVKEIDLCEEEVPYWTTLGKRESYKPRPSLYGVGAQTPYYARKEFMNCYLLGDWEIARDAEINPFKDVLNPINWEKPPKNGDGEWHAKIRIIDPDGEVFTKTFQSIPTSRKLSEKEESRETSTLDSFHDT
ncbi:MAK10-like protein [Tanacetum coccineum]